MELSVVIPARNEMFLKNTIEDFLKNRTADSEVIAVLDGAWADPPIPQNERVNVIYVPESIGQRAATNMGVRLSKAKYICKVDAHCAFDEGFDSKMIEFMEKMGEDVTAVPIMRNLWAFDWQCKKCGERWYQGPTPIQCRKEGCDSNSFERVMMWIGKKNPQSWSYCFDTEPHFQYFEHYKHRPEVKKQAQELGYTETMSLQGSFFMCTREKYWELKLCDEELGNWGNQGIEVAAKTWLSGGRVLVNHRTWYAHMFRTQGGDFGFPYPLRGREVHKTKTRVKEMFYENKWEKQVRPLSWLIEKFKPVPVWHDDAGKETLEKILRAGEEFYRTKGAINAKE